MNNVFGMRSGYTCCLANMHHGWTKFATHLWYGVPGGGLAALAYSPCTVTARVGDNGTEVTLHEKTSYPFEDRIDLEISTSEAVSFPLRSEEHTSELQSLMRISYAVFCVKKNK